MAESKEQIAVISWAKLFENDLPPLWFLHSSVNGAWTKNRFEARKLKREGLKNGIPDLNLPFPVHSYCGLYIEMKDGKNTTTEEQKEWLNKLASVGHKVSVCYGRIEAKQTILKYLGEIYTIKTDSKLNILYAKKK